MKNMFSILTLTLTLALTTSSASAAFSIRFADDEVIIRVADDTGGIMEYTAKATDPSQLIQVGLFANGKIDRYERPIGSELDKGETIKLEEVAPHTWLVPQKRWDIFKKAWDTLKKEVKVEPVDFPAVRPSGGTLFVVEEKTESYITLRLTDSTKKYRGHHPASDFAYPPPEGKAFKLGTLRGRLVPVVGDRESEHGILPVSRK